MELTSSKFLNCRLLSTFALVLFLTNSSQLAFNTLPKDTTEPLEYGYGASPLSIETLPSEFDTQSYFTSGLDTASLLSSDAQTAFLSGNLFSEVIIPTPVPAHLRIPEYYTAEHSGPPTPNFADYPIRVDGTTIHDPSHDPRFPLLTQRFITNNEQKERNRT